MTGNTLTPTTGATSLYHSLPREQRQQLIVERFAVLKSQSAVAREVGCSESVVSRQLSNANVIRPKGTPPADGSAAPLDVELTAMRRVWEAVMPLSKSQRIRVLKQSIERTREKQPADHASNN